MKHLKLLYKAGIIITSFLPFQLLSQHDTSTNNEFLFSTMEEIFAFKTTHINEFIRRFNDEPTLAKSVIQNKYPELSDLKRDKLVRFLFDLDNPNIDSALITEFTNDVTDSINPHFLSYPDSNYYAEIGLQIFYNEKPYNGKIILKNRINSNNLVSWVITGLDIGILEDSLKSYSQDWQVSGEKVPLNPTDHFVSFLKLKRALKENPKEIINYLDKRIDSSLFNQFIQGLANGEIQVCTYNYIKYHFLQVHGWIFILENKARNSRNSGWLISSLIKLDPDQKSQYRNLILKESR